MASTFTVDVEASDHPVWSGTARSVVIPDREGAMTFLAGHEPLLTLLEPGDVRVTSADGTVHTFAVDDGFAAFDHNRLVVAVDHSADKVAGLSAPADSGSSDDMSSHSASSQSSK